MKEQDIDLFYNKYIEPQKSNLISKLDKEIKDYIKAQRGIGIGIIIIFSLFLSVMPFSIMVDPEYYIQTAFIPLFYVIGFMGGFVALGIYLIKTASNYKQSEYDKHSQAWILEFLQLIGNQQLNKKRYSKNVVLFWLYLIVGGFTNMAVFSSLPLSLIAIPIGIFIFYKVYNMLVSPKVILFENFLWFKGDYKVFWNQITSVDLNEKWRSKLFDDENNIKFLTHIITINVDDKFYFDIDLFDRDKLLAESIWKFIQYKASLIN